jgi:hypothetical protein
MKEDTTKLAEPYWRTAYMLLAEHYKLLEQMLQARVANLTEAQKRTEELEEHVKFHKDRYEALQADYVARLKALGMSQKDIEEFDTYWKAPKEY